MAGQDGAAHHDSVMAARPGIFFGQLSHSRQLPMEVSDGLILFAEVACSENHRNIGEAESKGNGREYEASGRFLKAIIIR